MVEAEEGVAEEGVAEGACVGEVTCAVCSVVRSETPDFPVCTSSAMTRPFPKTALRYTKEAGLLLLHLVALHKLLNSSFGIYNLLLTRKERVTDRADFDINFIGCGAGGKRVPTRTGYLHKFVLWVNAFSHLVYAPFIAKPGDVRPPGVNLYYLISMHVATQKFPSTGEPLHGFILFLRPRLPDPHPCCRGRKSRLPVPSPPQTKQRFVGGLNKTGTKQSGD